MAKKKDFTNSIQYILLAIAVIVFIAVMVIGFKPDSNQPPVITTLGDDEPFVPADEEPVVVDLFSTLLGKASNDVESYWYNYSDSSLDYTNSFMIRGRFGKILLEEPAEINGNQYNWVYFDRLKKVALGRCSQSICEEHDLDFDYVDYEDYYLIDPVEWMFKLQKPVYEGEEMLGNQIVEVFNITGPGQVPGKVWVQQYYGLLLKIELEEEDGLRTIKFEDMHPNAVRIGHVMLPINFTIEGERYGYGWYGYIDVEYDEKLVYN